MPGEPDHARGRHGDTQGCFRGLRSGMGALKERLKLLSPKALATLEALRRACWALACSETRVQKLVGLRRRASWGGCWVSSTARRCDGERGS